METKNSRCFTVIGAAVTILDEFIVQSEARQGCHDITKGQTEKAGMRLKAGKVVTDRINTKFQRTSEERHTLT